MMFKSHGKGSFVLKGVWGGVKIERASGTTDKALYRKLEHMLDTLADAGRSDVLLQVARGHVTPLTLWRSYRGGDWSGLPTSAHVIDLRHALETWWRKIPGERHGQDLEQASIRVLAIARPDATLSDLPDTLRRLRRLLEDRGRQFNKIRDAMSAFLRVTLTRAHPLYLEVRAIESLRVTKTLPRNPQSPERAWVIREILGGEAGRIWWNLCCTGMNPKEYWRDGWHEEDGHLRIAGRKRPGRNRLVPLIAELAPPKLTVWGFTTALRRSGSGVTPMDGRRSFAFWLELARIWDTHQQAYMGHGRRTITDLYRGHDVTPFLDEDAEKITAMVVGYLAGSPKGTPSNSMSREGIEPSAYGLKVRKKPASNNPHARNSTPMGDDEAR